MFTKIIKRLQFVGLIGGSILGFILFESNGIAGGCECICGVRLSNGNKACDIKGKYRAENNDECKKYCKGVYSSWLKKTWCADGAISAAKCEEWKECNK